MNNVPQYKGSLDNFEDLTNYIEKHFPGYPFFYTIGVPGTCTSFRDGNINSVEDFRFVQESLDNHRKERLGF